MSDLVLLAEVLECTCMLLYVVLIIRIGLSRICGLLSVVSFMVGLLVALTPPMAWILKVLWVINLVGAIGSILGKLIIVIHRYSVLRSSSLAENKWSRSLVYRLVGVQFLVPCTSSISVHFYNFKYEQKEGKDVVVSFSNVGLVTSKYITTTAYVIYVVASVVLSILTSRSLARLSTMVGEAVWGITSFMQFTDAANAIWPFYPYVNGLATYTAPVILVICSSKVRGLFLPKTWRLPSTVYTTQSTETA
ncbi:hypothetical protein PRIPAC_78605 [Pristionchus pacificus]|uniref:G protein-coupled receptor n=1 Tax=Pristionchus pacificus TaxID=54126 RepID=A0A2A6CPY5_PRIPA|nr:hypothetical protein PRIPAC_78605 [Pristionchus pacificus]|eukprot:PDM80272.1 G protein-coupled receptor [Pristionchus pacificus]